MTSKSTKETKSNYQCAVQETSSIRINVYKVSTMISKSCLIHNPSIKNKKDV